MDFDIKLIQESFEQIVGNAEEFSANFYANLFLDYPHTESLFSRTNMGDQRKQLMMTLILVVKNLDHPDFFIGSLEELGERHVRYGVTPDMYGMVGATLLKTLEMHLQDAWSFETERSWTNAYEVVCQVMLKGAERGVAKMAEQKNLHTINSSQENASTSTNSKIERVENHLNHKVNTKSKHKWWQFWKWL